MNIAALLCLSFVVKSAVKEIEYAQALLRGAVIRIIIQFHVIFVSLIRLHLFVGELEDFIISRDTAALCGDSIIIHLLVSLRRP